MNLANKTYKVRLTEREMQMIVYAVTGFYRRANADKTAITPEQTSAIINAFKKFKEATDTGIILPGLQDKDDFHGSESSINNTISST